MLHVSKFVCTPKLKFQRNVMATEPSLLCNYITQRQIEYAPILLSAVNGLIYLRRDWLYFSAKFLLNLVQIKPILICNQIYSKS